MKIIKATTKELGGLDMFYNMVCESTRNIGENAKWVYGIYPNRSMIESLLNDFYIVEEDGGNVIAAVALPDGQEDFFDSLPWKEKLDKSEITEMRLFAVFPYQEKGYSSKVLDEIFKFLKDKGKKVIRLCLIDCNKVAEKCYIRNGFQFVGSKKDETPNISWETIKFYERYL